MTKKDRKIVLERIDIEGFDYAFIYYSDFQDIKDKKFHELRLKYKQAHADLKKYLGANKDE